jgi:hypothetical protein
VEINTKNKSDFRKSWQQNPGVSLSLIYPGVKFCTGVNNFAANHMILYLGTWENDFGPGCMTLDLAT